jgi:hypothetical protein
MDVTFNPPDGLPLISGTSPFAGGPNGNNAGADAINNAGTGDNDPNACRGCSLTYATDLASDLRGQEQSRKLDAAVSGTPGKAGDDLTNYANTLWSYGTNGGLKGMMENAAPDVDAAMHGSYASDLFNTVDTIKDLLNRFGVDTGLIVTKPDPKNWAIAFKPIQARVLIGQYKCPGGTCLPSQLVYHNYYPQPLVLAETRARAARSYCAMRQAAREQRSLSDSLDSLGQ